LLDHDGGTEGVSSEEIPISLADLHIPLLDLCKSPEEIPISLADLCISSRKIPISLEEIHKSKRG